MRLKFNEFQFDETKLMRKKFEIHFKIKWFLFLGLCLFLSLFSDASKADEKFVLATGATAPWGPGDNADGYLKHVALEVFRRINIEVEVIYLPPERALVNVNNGKIDGDIFRISGIEKKYTNLIMVPEPIAIFEFTGFILSGETSINFSGWSSLETHSVGLIQGWKYYENNITTNTNIVKVSKAELLIGLLRDKKVDVILYERWMALHFAKKLNVPLQRFKKTLAAMPMHIYLHKKHAVLVPEISSELAKMKADGTIQIIHANTLAKLEKSE